MNKNNHKLILGTVQFGMGYGISNVYKKKVSENEVKEILSFAFKQRIETLDTATTYGESESILGNIGVKRFNVITKLPKLPCNKNFEESILKCTQQSLSNLKLEFLYGLLVHNAESMLSKQGEGIYKSLVRLKEEGLVKKIGVSVYHPNEIKMIMNHYDFERAHLMSICEYLTCQKLSKYYKVTQIPNLAFLHIYSLVILLLP